MMSINDKFSGIANHIIGKIKEETGKLTENDYLEDEGLAQILKGKVQRTTGTLKDTVKNGIYKL